MLGRYLEHFDDFLRFARTSITLLLNQERVTDTWQANFDSVIEALCWDIFPGMGIVLVLLDDNEFGKDIKWFFSPLVKDLIDFKLLLIFVETSMELMLIVVQDSGIIQKIFDTPEAGVPVVERGFIHSPSYCFNFDPSNIIPNNMNDLVQFINKVKVDPPFDTIFIQNTVFKNPIFCWQIINNISGCITYDVACMGGSLMLQLSRPMAGTGALSPRILAMAKIQLEIIATLIRKHLERESE